MAWKIKVQFDPTLRYYHLVYRDVVLETPEDVRAWSRDLEGRMLHEPGKVDVIIDLEGLTVKPAVVKLYDEQRIELLGRRTRHAYRYSGNPLIRTKILTSATLAGQSANVFETFEQALDALKADRAREGTSGR
jgi:hypothetical protein